ncbi:methyltransferase domain-containing protein [Streptomyces rhizosphaericus]|uniref:hypothetical protein n=1 Tax=Streptomyces rhizosphaericus TaxID=114699 RepID=UPI000A39F49C|nr:hypothetical protein [Streptomyces rhizosphaericus]
MSIRTLTVFNWNFENNGGGNATKWRRAHEKVRRMKPDLGFRQEMWGADMDEHKGVLKAELAEQTAHRLDYAGYRPEVRTEDAGPAAPEHAPYDRIITTRRRPCVPWAWIEQAKPGAVIVVPIGGGVARLTVALDGSATGRFLPQSVMAVGAAVPSPRLALLQDEDVVPSSTCKPMVSVLDRLQFVLSVALPGHRRCTWTDENGQVEAAGLWMPDGSMMRADVKPRTVRQMGPRLLRKVIAEMDDALPAGDLDPADFGLTVTRSRQRVWFRDPDGAGWDLPTAWSSR